MCKVACVVVCVRDVSCVCHACGVSCVCVCLVGCVRSRAFGVWCVRRV